VSWKLTHQASQSQKVQHSKTSGQTVSIGLWQIAIILQQHVSHKPALKICLGSKNCSMSARNCSGRPKVASHGRSCLACNLSVVQAQH